MVIQKPKGDWNLYKEEVKPVHAACEAGDIVAVSEFFEAGSEAREWLAEEKKMTPDCEMAMPASHTNGGWSLLFYSAASGNVEVIKFLLEMGADIKRIDRYGQSANAYAKGPVARTIIKNEQMKLDKRAECHDLLDDVHDMLEHAAGLVKELDKVNESTLHITDRVLAQSRKASGATSGSGADQNGQSDAEFKDGSGTPRLVEHYNMLDGIGKVEGLPPKTSAEVLEELDSRCSQILREVWEMLDECRKCHAACKDAVQAVSRLMDGYFGAMPLRGDEVLRAGELFAAGCNEGDEPCIPDAASLSRISDAMFLVERNVTLLSAEEGEAMIKRYSKNAAGSRLGPEQFMYMYSELHIVLRMRYQTVAVDEMFAEHGERLLGISSRFMMNGSFERSQEMCGVARACFAKAASPLQPGRCDDRLPAIEEVLGRIMVLVSGQENRVMFEEKLEASKVVLKEAKEAFPSVFRRIESFELMARAKGMVLEAQAAFDCANPPMMDDPGLLVWRFAKWKDTKRVRSSVGQDQAGEEAEQRGGDQTVESSEEKEKVHEKGKNEGVDAHREKLGERDEEDGVRRKEGEEHEQKVKKGASETGGKDGGVGGVDADGARSEGDADGARSEGDADRTGGRTEDDEKGEAEGAKGQAKGEAYEDGNDDTARMEVGSDGKRVEGHNESEGAGVQREKRDVGSDEEAARKAGGASSGEGAGGEEPSGKEEGAVLKTGEEEEDEEDEYDREERLEREAEDRERRAADDAFLACTEESWDTLIRESGLSFGLRDREGPLGSLRRLGFGGSAEKLGEQEFISAFAEAYEAEWFRRADAKLEDAMEDILALEQRAEKSKEGERLFASAQKAFAGGLFQRALEESSLAKQLFLDSSTHHFTMYTNELVEGSRSANVEVHRREADTAILKAKRLASQDEFDDAKEALDAAAKAYAAVSLTDVERDGARVPIIMADVIAADELRTVEVTLPSCERIMRPADTLMLNTQLEDAELQYRLAVDICTDAHSAFPQNARLRRLLSSLYLRRAVAHLARAVAAGEVSCGPHYRALIQAEKSSGMCPEWSQPWLMLSVAHIGLGEDPSVAIAAGLLCATEGGPCWKKLAVLKSLSEAAKPVAAISVIASQQGTPSKAGSQEVMSAGSQEDLSAGSAAGGNHI